MKQKQPVSFYPKAQLFIATNEEPAFKTFDSGDRRRNIVFTWEGDWESNGINDFEFLKDREFKELFLTLLVWRALGISNAIKQDKDTYSVVGYYIHNMPESIRSQTDMIKTESSQNISKVNNYLDDGQVVLELLFNDITYIDVLETHKIFTQYLSAQGDKMNYKDFLSTLQTMGIIPQQPERIPFGDDGKKKQVYRRLR